TTLSVLSLSIRPLPTSPLFPYTTLFRSNFLRELRSNPELLAKQALVHSEGSAFAAAKGLHMPTLELRASTGKDHSQPGLPYRDRSEEHTSELQSRENLVCRLLLEKKKKK